MHERVARQTRVVRLSMSPPPASVSSLRRACQRLRAICVRGTLGPRGFSMSDEDLKAEVERLKAENEQLKNQRGRSVSLKVSEKGGVSVYGLGRFPVTLYKEQWARLLAMADEIRAFIKENEPKLKAKPE